MHDWRIDWNHTVVQIYVFLQLKRKKKEKTQFWMWQTLPDLARSGMASTVCFINRRSHGYEGLPFVIDILADFYGTILSDWVRNLVHDREPTAVESLANFTWISPFIKSMLCVSALWVLWVVPPNGRVRTWQSTSCHTFGVHVGTLWCTLPCLDHNVQLGCGSGLSCIPPGVQVTGSQFWGSQFAKLLSLWITFLMKYIIFKFLQFGL